MPDSAIPIEASIDATAQTAPATAKAVNAPAQTPAQAPPVQQVITLAQANSVIEAAVKKANEIKSPSNFAIADPYGHLVSFQRMDGAVLASIDVATKKAKTVSLFGGKFPSGYLYNQTIPGGSIYGIAQTNNGLIFFGGGVPLKAGGNFVGSLGVSGGLVDQDVSIANAGAAALK
ncbi:DUF336-domain-containing protein [Tothia fuscella]|uniref:DUF336-domain-containing protein n=1 Tax=Tothia fuscella TaxID=1048955 RepID=A0A9P4NZU5_9PEZI|nr:DUF336-domain-containing protein [Tothia fuscella]